MGYSPHISDGGELEFIIVSEVFFDGDKVVEPSAFLIKKAGQLRREPSFTFGFRFWDRFEPVIAAGIAFENPPLDHPHQNRQGPVGTVLIPFPAARTPANFASGHEFPFPGFYVIVNLTLVSI